MKKIIVIIYILLLSVSAEVKTVQLTVSYISAKHVYLSGGKKQGLQTGDSAKVSRDGKTIAELQVVFTADGSASCKILRQREAIRTGDKVVVYTQMTDKEKEISTKTQITKKNTPPKKKRLRKKSLTRVSGSVGMQWYRFIDTGERAYNFTQPALHLNLRARKLWNKDYNLRVRFRSRYYERANRSSSLVPATEWRNRLYVFSFSYDDPKSVINFKAGRILSNAFSGVGYIDGLQLQHNISARWQWGVFAGFQPELVYSRVQTNRRKYGLYLHYVGGKNTAQRFESTFAASGEYEGSTVSRELIYLQSSYYETGCWNLYQSMELDLNRQWRKEKTGKDVSLTSLYLSGQVWLSKGLSATMSYDNRRNYYIYEYRTLADSLFDDAFRQGLRLRFNYRFLKNYRFYLSGGLRQRDAEERLTYSYSGGIFVRNILLRRFSINARAAAFSNVYNRGVTYSVRLYQYLRGGHNLSLAFGANEYRLRNYDSGGLNRWARANILFQLPFNFDINGYYEYDWGSDVNGHRFLTEVGYTF